MFPLGLRNLGRQDSGGRYLAIKLSANCRNQKVSRASVLVVGVSVVVAEQFVVQGGGSVLPGVLTSPAMTGATKRHTASAGVSRLRIKVNPPNY